MRTSRKTPGGAGVLQLFILSFAVSLALAGCTVGPNYHRPAVATPPAYKEQPPWRTAEPRDQLPKGQWWAIFTDDELNQLEARALAANQTIEVARNQLQQARAAAQVATSGLFPQLAAQPSIQRQRTGATLTSSGLNTTQSTLQLPFNLNYEADLFGGIRRSIESANAQYQASAANLGNVQLVIEAELAADFFTARELDAEITVVDEAVGYEQRGLDLVERRHGGGIASGLDVAQQQTLLDSTRTQAALLRQQRAQFEHAIAVLVGEPASDFILPARPLQLEPPAIPAGVPSDLLERRPDVAQAERLIAAQNAQIGVATSARYPSLGLFGGGGWQTRDLAQIVNVPSTFWSLGAGLAEPLLNGGRITAQIHGTRAAYGAAVADYRNTVLTAISQVEDGLSGLAVLSAAAATQQQAVADAQRALTLANERYVGGLVTYLDVITAQETLLTNQRLATQLLGQRLVTSVALIKALGGGWDSASLQGIGVQPALRQAISQ
ncbi:MAG TPA: efflux transporter outer membrane subunit [Terriglobales bacterium]|nr:efflux transporter outer membrane subunit [Terriglobales bacterium]